MDPDLEIGSERAPVGWDIFVGSGLVTRCLARLIQRGQGLSVDFDRAGLSVRRRGGVGI